MGEKGMSGKSGNAASADMGNNTSGEQAALLLLSLVVFIGITVWVNSLQSRDEQYLKHAGELRVLSQELSTNAVESASGNREAFGQLRVARDKFAEHWGVLSKGDASIGLEAAQVSNMTNVQQVWEGVNKHADQIVRSQ